MIGIDQSHNYGKNNSGLVDTAKVISQVITYSGQSLMSRRPPLKWLVYTVMEVFEESNHYSFSWASKVAQLNFLWINRPNTLYYSSQSHCCTNMYDQVTGSSGRQLLQKWDHF